MKYETFWRWIFAEPMKKTVAAKESRGVKVNLKSPKWARGEIFFACQAGDYGVWLIIDAVTGLKVNRGLDSDLSLAVARRNAEERLTVAGRDSYYLAQGKGLRKYGSPDPDFAPLVRHFLAETTP